MDQLGGYDKKRNASSGFYYIYAKLGIKTKLRTFKYKNISDAETDTIVGLI